MKTTIESNQNSFRKLFLISLLVVVIIAIVSLAICGIFSGTVSMSALGFGTSLNFGLFLVSLLILMTMIGVLYFLITNNRELEL